MVNYNDILIKMIKVLLHYVSIKLFQTDSKRFRIFEDHECCRNLGLISARIPIDGDIKVLHCLCFPKPHKTLLNERYTHRNFK